MDIMTHDPLRHLKALRQTLSQDKKPIGFFISAGCPLSVQTEELVQTEESVQTKKGGNKPLIPDMKRLYEYIEMKLKSEDKSKPSNYEKLIAEIKKTEKNGDNLEDILSFVRSLKEVSQGGGIVRGFKEEELIQLEKNICKHIVEKFKVELPNKDTSYHKFARWISSIDRDKAIEIFTTNYDLLLEQALEDTSIPYFDGFVGSRQSFFDLRSVEENLIPTHWARLWKIHGSINWFQKQNNEIFRSDAFKNDEKDASYLIYPSHLKYDQSRKMPFLALSDQLSRFLKQPSAALILCGYSFNDEHINDTIINALKSNPTAIVIALMFDTMSENSETGKVPVLDRYPKGTKIAINHHNLSFWTYDEAIIGTNRGRWSKPTVEIDEDLKRFIIESANTTMIKMGDFKIFTDFLCSLIGQSTEQKKDEK
jgi:hypothetical protein